MANTTQVQEVTAAGVETVVPGRPAMTEAEMVIAEAIAEAFDPQLVARLAVQARAQGVQLLGRGGVLQQMTKRFLETALEAEMDEHLGYGKHDPAGRNHGNSRNGKRLITRAHAPANHLGASRLPCPTIVL